MISKNTLLDSLRWFLAKCDGRFLGKNAKAATAGDADTVDGLHGTDIMSKVSHKISVVGSTFDNNIKCGFWYDGEMITSILSRGTHLVILDTSRSNHSGNNIKVFQAGYDTYGNYTLNDNIVAKLQECHDKKYIVILFSYDAISLTSQLNEELALWGSNNGTTFGASRNAIAFIGQYGMLRGQAYEKFGGSSTEKLTATLVLGSLVKNNNVSSVTLGNATTATKLQTSRTLWGQSFDGSANISGDLTGVANIKASGELELGSKIWMANGASIYAKNTSGSYEQFLWPRWNDNVMYLNFGSGGFNIRNKSSSNVMWMSNNGQVGIGTTSPSYKLDVNGSARVGSAVVDNTLGVSGLLTANGGITVGANKRVGQTDGSGLYVGTSNNSGWVYLQDMQSQTANKWKIHQAGGAEFSGKLAVGTINTQTETLYVAGTARITGAVTMGSTLNVGGQTTLSNTRITKNLRLDYTNAEFTICNGDNRYEFCMLISAAGEDQILSKTKPMRLRPGVEAAESLQWVHVSGGLHTTSGLYSDTYVSALGQNTSSDARLKDITKHITLRTEDIADAPSVEFAWKKNGQRAVGTIAQYWQNVLPLAVHEDFTEEKHLTMQYDVCALLSSISNAKEILKLQEENKYLMSEVAALRNGIKDIRRVLNELRDK